MHPDLLYLLATHRAEQLRRDAEHLRLIQQARKRNGVTRSWVLAWRGFRLVHLSRENLETAEPSRRRQGFSNPRREVLMMNRRHNVTELVYEFDLGNHELRRRAETFRALGADWSPLVVLQGENEAYDRLYSGLDAEQLAIYHRLISAGVLPGREDDRDAA